jgi:hypothetical protein
VIPGESLLNLRWHSIVWNRKSSIVKFLFFGDLPSTFICLSILPEIFLSMCPIFHYFRYKTSQWANDHLRVITTNWHNWKNCSKRTRTKKSWLSWISLSKNDSEQKKKFESIATKNSWKMKGQSPIKSTLAIEISGSKSGFLRYHRIYIHNKSLLYSVTMRVKVTRECRKTAFPSIGIWMENDFEWKFSRPNRQILIVSVVIGLSAYEFISVMSWWLDKIECETVGSSIM